jgi:phosphoribosylamine---glycine ligase
VVMAANGYPGTVDRGTIIGGVEEAEKTGAIVFHAGTQISKGRLLANGGRVLNVTAKGATLKDAMDAAYIGVGAIEWPGGFCRHDIGEAFV